MLFISHRGNLSGPCPDRENSPDYIDAAIAAGFTVEVDLWIKDGQRYLGHKSPTYPIDQSWLESRVRSLLIHTKNQEAVREISKTYDFHFFCNEKDEFSLTSNGYVLYWSRDMKNDVLNKHCLLPLIKHADVVNHLMLVNCAGGVISDYIRGIKEFYDFYLSSR